MYEIVITCLSCEAQRSISHVEDSTLSDADVIAQSGHTPQCNLKGATNVMVECESRPSEPNVILYTIKEA